jgi:hypothetical protein
MLLEQTPAHGTAVVAVQSALQFCCVLASLQNEAIVRHWLMIGLHWPSAWSQLLPLVHMPLSTQTPPVQRSRTAWCAPLQAGVPLVAHGQSRTGLLSPGQPGFSTHVPVMHIFPGAQVVPFGAVPVGLQTDVPVLHEVAPV